jgi:hypothetical protein
MNKKLLALFGVLALGAGAAGAVALQSHAQSVSGQTATNTVVSSGNTATTSPVDVPESPNDPADTANSTGSPAHGHAPLGGDGIVASITGTTLVIGEESNEGGASYNVDASHATVTNNGVSASISDIKVGDKIFVQGTVTGTNVAATSVSLGHSQLNGKNDTDGGAQSETSEAASSTDASDQ